MLARLGRLTRLLTATALVVAALAVVAGPAQATCGNKLCLEMTRSPDAASGFTYVSLGGIATYVVSVSNTSTATATKVTLRFEPPPGGAQVLRLKAEPPSSCTPTPTPTAPVAGPISCNLGNLKPASKLVFTFDVQMLVADADAPTTATLSSDARDKDTANNPSDPTKETLIAEDGITVDGTDGQAASLVPKDLPVALNTDSDDSGANADDPRTAVFTLSAKTFSTTALISDEEEDAGFECPPGLKCPSGGWTQAVIPAPLLSSGIVDPLGPFLPPNAMYLELVYDAGTLPSTLTTRNYVLLHDRDHLVNTREYQEIDQRCGGNPQPSCLDKVQFLENGDLYVKALVDGNWRYR